jgi:hypothetical protein
MLFLMETKISYGIGLIIKGESQLQLSAGIEKLINLETPKEAEGSSLRIIEVHSNLNGWFYVINYSDEKEIFQAKYNYKLELFGKQKFI